MLVILSGRPTIVVFLFTTGFSEDCLRCQLAAYPAKADKLLYEMAKGM